jgi:histidinol-phosphate aminotransferase
VSVTVVTAALADPREMVANVERVDAERDRLAGDLRAVGWPVGPSVTNFLLVDFGTVERAAEVATGLLERGLVPRTFAAGHPLAHCLRLTVRDRAGNERLVAAAAAVEGRP